MSKFFVFTLAICSLFSEIKPFLESLGGFSVNSRNYKRLQLEHYVKAYELNHYENVTPSQSPRIPKLIHMIWLGSKLPKRFVVFMESWKQHHPDWTFKLWTDEDIGSFPFETGDAIHKVENYGQKSDIFRYEILNRFGGLYIDTDFFCLKPHDILHHTCDFYTGMGPQIVYNGNIGAAPNHPIIQTCLRVLSKINIDKCHNGANSILHATGPKFFTNVILDQLKKDPNGCIVYPTSYFYSFPIKMRRHYWKHCNMSVVKRFAKEESFATHVWALSWTPKQSALNIKPVQHKRHLLD